MIWVGGIIVVLTFAAIIKRYETRMVLLIAGILMALLSGNISAAVNAFTKAMVNGGLVTTICTVMGFAYAIKFTECDRHLVHGLSGSLKRFRPILIPGSVLITYFVCVALPSAAGCSAAVGTILIPMLISAGVHPAMAGSAVLAGTWGSVLSPGLSHNPFVAKLANVDVMTVIATHSKSSLTALIAVTIIVTIVAFLRKENKGYVSESVETIEQKAFSVNWLKAIVPIIPLVLLVLGSKQVHVIPFMSVPMAMLLGTFVAILVVMADPQKVTQEFFNGMGHAYGDVMGIIIAAAVFTKGMELIGLTGALIAVMKESDQIARISATFGPFIIAVLCGSGDAAAMAFNSSITPHAGQFGFGIIELGSQAQIVGGLGRSMSPVSGSSIICSQLAGVNPIELTKRNAPAMLIGAIVMMFMLL